MLDEKLDGRLESLKDKARVTADELEGMVKDCLEEVGQWLLGKLLEFEPWIQDAEKATHWTCPGCGNDGPRAQDQEGQPLFEELELNTTIGPVPWRAPLFSCRSCRRFFSPRTPVL